jgi:hypothetical protein
MRWIMMDVVDRDCTPHEAIGMLGSVTVGKPTTDGQSALAPPQDRLSSEAQQKLKSLNSTVTGALDNTHHDDPGAHIEAEDGRH